MTASRPGRKCGTGPKAELNLLSNFFIDAVDRRLIRYPLLNHDYEGLFEIRGTEEISWPAMNVFASLEGRVPPACVDFVQLAGGKGVV